MLGHARSSLPRFARPLCRQIAPRPLQVCKTPGRGLDHAPGAACCARPRFPSSGSRSTGSTTSCCASSADAPSSRSRSPSRRRAATPRCMHRRARRACSSAWRARTGVRSPRISCGRFSARSSRPRAASSSAFASRTWGPRRPSRTSRPARRRHRGRVEQRAGRRAGARRGGDGRDRRRGRGGDLWPRRALSGDQRRARQLDPLRGARGARHRAADRRRQDLDPLQRARRGRHPRAHAQALRRARHRPHQDRVAAAARAAVGVRLLPRSEGAPAGAAGRAGARRGRARRDAAQGPGLVPGGAARGLMDLRALVAEWIRTLTPYPPGKPIEELERELGIRDSIKLASNENPLGPSPKAVAAITAALADLHRYPDGSAFYLKRRLAERLGVSEAELIVGNGSNEIIELAGRTFLRPGDEAVLADQAFVVYRLVVQSAGGSSRMVPLRDFTHDLEAIAAAVTPRTRLVFLGNPNNPTGTIVRRAAWRAFLGRLPEHLLVVADDAYAEYVEDPEYPDTIRERGDGRVAVLSLRTFSKLYGLAGLRVGYGVASGPVIDALDRIRQPFNVNALALAGALAALDDEEHVRRTLATNRAGMAFLVEAFRTLGLAHVPSAANFILVRVGDGARVYEALLRRGVIVRPMAVYGFPEHVRVTVGTEAENARFVAALRAVLA